jgi:hypothetical protein
VRLIRATVGMSPSYGYAAGLRLPSEAAEGHTGR